MLYQLVSNWIWVRQNSCMFLLCNKETTISMFERWASEMATQIKSQTVRYSVKIFRLLNIVEPRYTSNKVSSNGHCLAPTNVGLVGEGRIDPPNHLHRHLTTPLNRLIGVFQISLYPLSSLEIAQHCWIIYLVWLSVSNTTICEDKLATRKIIHFQMKLQTSKVYLTETTGQLG